MAALHGPVQLHGTVIGVGELAYVDRRHAPGVRLHSASRPSSESPEQVVQPNCALQIETVLYDESKKDTGSSDVLLSTKKLAVILDVLCGPVMWRPYDCLEQSTRPR